MYILSTFILFHIVWIILYSIIESYLNSCAQHAYFVMVGEDGAVSERHIVVIDCASDERFASCRPVNFDTIFADRWSSGREIESH